MPPPSGFLSHLRETGYHPRSNQHSNALGKAITDNLIAQCGPVAEQARAGLLVYELNFDLIFGRSQWNVDLVLGASTPGTLPPEEGPIRRSAPSTVQIAVEFKSVMTEHRKAVKNRKRDFEAHHQHVHDYSEQAIAAGILVVNGSESFKSPLRQDPTRHHEPFRLVEHCVEEMRNVTDRRGATGDGLDAKAVIVVSMDNQDLPSTQFLDAAPAPTTGDPLHYDAFIQRLCAAYRDRFL